MSVDEVTRHSYHHVGSTFLRLHTCGLSPPHRAGLTYLSLLWFYLLLPLCKYFMSDSIVCHVFTCVLLSSVRRQCTSELKLVPTSFSYILCFSCLLSKYFCYVHHLLLICLIILNYVIITFSSLFSNIISYMRQSSFQYSL